jgi:hypothetical protein
LSRSDNPSHPSFHDLSSGSEDDPNAVVYFVICVILSLHLPHPELQAFNKSRSIIVGGTDGSWKK